MIDLRSDTVTRPTAAMRKAMADAEVGDDTLDGDPTVVALEETAAWLLGKEKALFTASGTMSNVVAASVFCSPGDSVLAFAESHMANHETGALAAVAGAQLRPVPSATGAFDDETVADFVRPPGVQAARPALVCAENTFDLSRGLAVPAPISEGAAAEAKEAGASLYLDGARLFNAAAALETDAGALSKGFDAVSVCLTKGLGAPVGAVLAGSADFIAEARRARQRLGGGWRQAGVIAAAGIVALESASAAIPDDHAKAEALRAGLEALELPVDRSGVLTNIVRADVAELGISAAEAAAHLEKAGVLVRPVGKTLVRAVVHRDVSQDDVARVIQACGRLLAQARFG